MGNPSEEVRLLFSLTRWAKCIEKQKTQACGAMNTPLHVLYLGLEGWRYGYKL